MSNLKNKIFKSQNKQMNVEKPPSTSPTSLIPLQLPLPSSPATTLQQQSISSISRPSPMMIMTTSFSKKNSSNPIILTKSLSIFLLTCFGILFIIIGLLFYLTILHSMIYKIINEKLILNKGSETYEKWKEIPMPLYYRYYFFNVSNPIDIERTGAKPLVQEIGPFTYRSRWVKESIKFYSNGTVSFRERKTLEFVRELSIASDRERILVTVNGPLAVTLALLQKAPIVVRNIVSLGLSGVAEGFFIRRSARELLFDGYHEVLTSFGPLLNPSIPNTKGKFAWLYGQNNTDDGLFTVFTGQYNFSKINQINRYNGKAELEYWKPKSECNRLQGTTDGQIISTNDQHTFKLFHPQICRTIKFNAIETGINATYFMPKNFNGNLDDIKITVDRYVPDSSTLSAYDENSSNQCYTSKITPSRPEFGDLLVSLRERNQSQRFSIKPFFHTKNGRIIFRSGVFDMSECKYGAPVLFSYPHFLYAHPNYRENIGGLRPDKRRHSFYMMIEPNTGTSIRSLARIQINIYLTKPPWISRFRYIPEVVFPVFWQELRADASIDMIEHLNWALTIPFFYADLLSIIIIIIGLIFIIISGYKLIRLKKQNIKTKTIINNDENFVMFPPPSSSLNYSKTINNNNNNNESPSRLSIQNCDSETTTMSSSTLSSTIENNDNNNQSIMNPVKS